VLAAENISKSYGERALLSDVTLQINQGDKIGLIGVNGTGKSTLLRLLAGEEAPDSGSIFCQPGHRVAYLPQNPVFAPEDTVLEHVLRGAGRDVQEESYRAKAILTRLSSICAKRVLPPPRKRQAALPPRAWSTLRPTWQTRWALSSK